MVSRHPGQVDLFRPAKRQIYGIAVIRQLTAFDVRGFFALMLTMGPPEDQTPQIYCCGAHGQGKRGAKQDVPDSRAKHPS